MCGRMLLGEASQRQPHELCQQRCRKPGHTPYQLAVRDVRDTTYLQSVLSDVYGLGDPGPPHISVLPKCITDRRNEKAASINLLNRKS